MPNLLGPLPVKPCKNSTTYTFVGIDPGVNGGIVSISPSGEITCVKMPSNYKDLWKVINGFSLQPTIACLEMVTGYITGSEAETSQMFTFGVNYGSLLAFLTLADITFDQVHPVTWQSSFGLKRAKENCDRIDWKRRLKAEAQRLFPSVKVTLWNADSLLLAEYGRRKYGTVD